MKRHNGCAPPQRRSFAFRFTRFISVTALMMAAGAAAGAQQASRMDSTGPERATQPASQQTSQQTSQQAKPLTRDEAVTLALATASTFQQAKLNELIATEDVKQARAAFLPRVSMPVSVIYNSPSTGAPPGADPFSFISANAKTEYEALAGVTGDLDLNGRLRATLKRQVALLEAARLGTEVARRALIQAVDESYYGLALAAARRSAAELSLAAAEEFEHVTELMLNAGEVAQVDLTRARLQAAGRRDELEQARAGEAVAADSLRVLIGYDITAPVAVIDLMSVAPQPAELDRFTADLISRRPEFAQFDAQARAAEEDARAARAERRPQLSYSIFGGFDTDSLHSTPLHEHSGVLASVSLTVPIFDWGASKSRERQAKLRAETIESQRVLARRGFAQMFNSARAQAASASARVQRLQSAVADAQRNLDASIARYRAGESLIIEVTDAQSTLAAQRTALNQAIFDYQIARARLAQATAQ